MDEEHLLAKTPVDAGDGSETRLQRGQTTQRQSHGQRLALVALAASLALNVVLLLGLAVSRQAEGSITAAAESISPYALLKNNILVPWEFSSPYGSANRNDTDRALLWESYSLGYAQVALDASWASLRGLPPSGPFPWDESKSIYSVRGFHSLHCLKKLHRWVTISHHNLTQIDDYWHVVHCVDALRQDTMCRADDTPMYSNGSDFGDGQLRSCRSWDALTRWADEHNACFAYVNETSGVDSMWERYKWCPRGSPYRERMRSYMGIAGTETDNVPADMDSIPKYWEGLG